MSDRLPWIRRLGIVAVAMTFLLMVLGAWVKANGAGLSCPDWPGCYGKFFPPFPSSGNGGVWQGHPVVYTQAQELYEWTHRAVVALIIVPVAAFALVAGTDKSLRPALRNLAMGAVAVYFLQAALGAVTVVTHNPPWATTLHLATAVMWFFMLTVATCIAHLNPMAKKATQRTTPRIHHTPSPPRAVGFVYPGEETSGAAQYPGEADHDR